MKRGKKIFSFILALTILFTLNLNMSYANNDDNDPVKVVVKGRESQISMANFNFSLDKNLKDLMDGKISTKSDCPPDHYSLINGDNRARLKDPIEQIVLIKIKYKGISEPSYATGFYAGPGKLLTAAHAVIGDKGDREIEWATAYFMLKTLNSHTGKYEYIVNFSPIYNTYITKYYQQFTSKKYDYAVMRIEGDVYKPDGTILAPLKLAKESELPEYAKRTPYIVGYPNPATHYRVQHSGTGTLKDEPGNRYYYDIDIEPGQSGAPILTTDASNRLVVIGIHTDGAGISYAPYPNLNSGLKLRTEITEFLGNCAW